MEDLFELRDRLYRLLDESFQPQQPETAPSFSPPVDILAADEEIVILVELPGMSRDDVTVEVDEAVVTIRGRRGPAESDGQYFVRERPTGSFSRSFSMTSRLDPDSVAAKLEDGVLRVTVQRHERSRHIEVSEAEAP
ncbi:MAG: Hsp20/alpha crystallin family protein [Armatimonadota bacterium]